MNDVETVQALHQAIENGDREAMRSLLTDDFVFDHGGMDGTMERDAFIGAMGNIQKGVRDVRFNLTELEGEGTVHGKARLTGTHNGTLDLSPLGGPTLPPTHKRFECTVEPATWVVQSGRVARHEVEAVEGGGLEGILAQIAQVEH